MKSKTVLSFLVGFTLAAGAALALCRKKCRKCPPHDAGTTPPAPNPPGEKPEKPVVGAQNPFAASPNPFGTSPAPAGTENAGANARPTLSAAPFFPPAPANGAAPIRSDGFTYRDLFFTQTGSLFNYRLTIKKIDRSLNYRYGVASYNVNTGLATDIPERSWYDGKNGEVTFPLLFGAAFAVTSDGAAESKTRTPAQRFNDGRGVKVVAPGSDQYYLMRPVFPSSVVRRGNTLVILHTSVIQQYAIINLKTGYPAFMWMDGNGGDLGFDYADYPDYPMMAVTREKDYNAHLILPERPEIVPGADPAHTQVGFDERTGQGLLTVDVTEGFAYAIAKENGELMTEAEKRFWSVTADTDQDLTVTVNEWNFFAAPALGSQIRFRVPPGGKYYMVTRLSDGTVVRSEPLEVPSIGKNITVGDNPQRGKPVTLVRIEPVSPFAEYATMDKRTGKINDFVAPRKDDDVMRIETNIPKDQVAVVARPRQFPIRSENDSVVPQAAKQTNEKLPDLQRVQKSDVRRIGNEITVMSVAEDQEYALYVPGTVAPASEWKKPEQGEVYFLRIEGKVQVVTRKSVSEPLPGMTVQADGVAT